MLDRLISTLVALCLAFLVWLYVRSRDQETLDNVLVPVQVTLASGQADHYELEINGPNQIPISFAGPPSRMRELRGMLQRGELHIEETLTVPEDRLEESRYLDTVRVDASDVHPPPGVMPLVLEGRNRIPVTLHRIVERVLPVRFQHAPLEHVGPVAVEPATVTVRGMQEVLDRIREIPTRRTLQLPAREPASRAETVTIESVPLVEEIEGHRIKVQPATIKAQVTFQPRQKNFELSEVSVQFLCPANFALKPMFRDDRAGKITVRLVGPSGEEVPAVVAYVDLSGRKWEPGLYEEPLKLQLPKDFQLAQSPPRLVAFQLVPPEQAPKAGAAEGP